MRITRNLYFITFLITKIGPVSELLSFRLSPNEALEQTVHDLLIHIYSYFNERCWIIGSSLDRKVIQDFLHITVQKSPISRPYRQENTEANVYGIFFQLLASHRG